jgi:hypothetical protein
MTRQRSPLSPLLFVGGCLATWAEAGVVALALGGLLGQLPGDLLVWDRAGRGTGTAVALLVLGVMPIVAPDAIPALTVPGAGQMDTMTRMGSWTAETSGLRAGPPQRPRPSEPAREARWRRRPARCRAAPRARRRPRRGAARPCSR